MPAIKKIIKDLTIEDPIEVFWNDAGDLDGGSDKTTAWRQYDEELAALKEIPVKTIGYFFKATKHSLFMVHNVEYQESKEKYIANRCVIPIGCITKIKRY
jgi:hypothetical protein|tara:strand:+ start:10194 stop:10493 length:300 start_codon:yes stop_codon:yes gene_type:complete